MAQTIILNQEDLDLIEETLVADAEVAGIFYKGPEAYNFIDNSTVRTNSLSLVGGWLDYVRGGTITKGEIQLTKMNYQLQQEKASSFQIDRLDQMENPAATIANVTDTYLKTVVSPNINHYAVEIIATNAGQVVAETITPATALTAYDDARQALEDAGTPAGNWVMLASSSYVRMLKESEAIDRKLEVSTFNGNISRKVNMLDGDVPIVTIPSAMTSIPGHGNLNFILMWVPAADFIPKVDTVKAVPAESSAGSFSDVVDFLHYFDVLTPVGTVNAIYASTTL